MLPFQMTLSDLQGYFTYFADLLYTVSIQIQFCIIFTFLVVNGIAVCHAT